MIRIRGLVKRFGARYALRGVDLDVGAGECLSLLGPNGAGKTTLLRILATLSKPSQGSVQVDGLDLAHDADALRRRVGFLSHQPLLYADLSGEENLRFYGRMYDVPDLEGRLSALLAQVGLERHRGDLVRTYSRGMAQRLAIARAFLHDPPLLLLDEPYTGLDQQAAGMLDRVLSEVGIGARTVLMTTHDLERGLRASQRVVVLARGQVVYHMERGNWDVERLRKAYAGQMLDGGVA
ncbi:MAG: heme ABC exporter ATP-binding protein CcmA [Anaerolineae bacterium]|nr:heme ABC exporter ATP-binding protein CcmA [Anaerolineae bacterium]